jgi:hypothetical protein
MLPNLREFVKLSKISSSQHYPYSLPFFQKYYNHPIYFPSFHHLLGLIILLLTRKVIEQVLSRLKLKIMSRKRAPNDPNLPFEDNEKEGGEGRSQLGGQWKVSILGGQWKVLMFSDP